MESAKYLLPALRHSTRNLWKKDFNLPISSFLRKYSADAATAHEEDIVVQNKIHLTKPSPVKWKRPPFLKNFFVGKFDTELFAFPEILDNEQLSELECIVKNISYVMEQKGNSLQVENNQSIPDSLLQELKDMGLFGRMIPSKYGGLDLCYTACTRLNEVLGLDWSLFCTLAAHEFLASEAVLKFGSDAQKTQYLPKFASGESIAAFCCSEAESGCDLYGMKTIATKNVDDSYTIDGTKTWVTNASRAGTFIVFAKSENLVNDQLSTISAFIVDKNSEGIIVEKQNKTCLHGLDTGVVHFQNVKVSSTNLIKDIGEGFSIYLKCLESFRLAQNSFTFGTLKALLDSVTERIIYTERLEESLADRQMVRRRLSKISTVIYGMESASYFTAAILDSTENPDVELESAALKLYNSRGTLYCIREMMDLIGSSSLIGHMQLDRFYRDAQGLAMFDAPNDIVKLFLGYSGLKAAGTITADNIVKLRNRFFFPKDAFKAQLKRMRVHYGFFKYDQDLAGHIHPSLTGCGNRLEEALQLFELCVQNIFAEHGKEIIYQQIDPKTLADAATDLYVISAVLSRCSRSYCIGLKNCHHELNQAGAFFYDSRERLLRHIQAILKGTAENNEAVHLGVGTQVVDCRGYFAEHPLKHNF